MFKKVIDVDRLRKMTEEGKKQAEIRDQEELRKENEKLDRTAQTLADDLISELPQWLEQAAQSGRDSICLPLSDSDEIRNRTYDIVSAWCLANDLSTTGIQRHVNKEIQTSYSFTVSWYKK